MALPSDDLRQKATPEQVALFDWTYEFTRIHWRSTLLIGACFAVAVENPGLDFWQILARAKGGVACLLQEEADSTTTRDEKAVSTAKGGSLV